MSELNVTSTVIQGEGKATYECGLANSLSTGRITGGSETLANQYPWVAHLRVFFWSGDSAMCTGTLINQQWILTAAHCTYGVVNVTVTLGAHDITTFNANQQVFYVSRTWNIHPQWRYGDVENDIALIQLPRAVNINSKSLDFIQKLKNILNLKNVINSILIRLRPTGLHALLG